MPMPRLTPVATPLLAQGLGGRFGPRPPNFKSTRTWLEVGRDAAGAGTSNLAQVLAQSSFTSSANRTTTLGEKPVRETGGFEGLLRPPLKRGRLATSKANAPTSLASYPWEAAAAVPSCVHA